MLDLEGKVVLITGGAGGIGQAFVREFLKNGSKVCVADISAETGNKFIEELSTDYLASRVQFCVCDVTKDESFQGAFKFCKENFGPVDILINNAGIINEGNWKLTMDVNLGGTIRGTELAIENMSKEKGHKGGRVINTASISGLKVIPFFPFYSATKSGIVQYTRTAGHVFHYGYTGVSINCLCPSLVNTPLIQGDSKKYTPQSGVALIKLAETFPIMGTEEIVSALFQLMEDDKTGSALVVNKDEKPEYCPSSLQ